MLYMPELTTNRSLNAIAVLTSGGDSPGMNPAIRAVTRAALNQGIRVFGVNKGYSGLIIGDLQEMSSASVTNIIQRGGTILKSDRCEAFKDPSIRKQAAEILANHGIDGLVVIGGDNDRPVLLNEACQNADLLVHEATYTEDILAQVGPEPQHSCAAQVARFAEQAAVPNLILTHFSPRYLNRAFKAKDRTVAELEAEARGYYQGALFMAQDFDCYRLGHTGQLARVDD